VLQKKKNKCFETVKIFFVIYGQQIIMLRQPLSVSKQILFNDVNNIIKI
jgi:hypothetical protein